MRLFFSSQIEGDRILLDEEESRHASAVLRKGVGETLHVIDGRGNRFTAEIVKQGKRETELLVVDLVFYPRPERQLHLAVAPTKNIERIEWLLEKSIEIGIDTISFLQCDRSERKQVNVERMRKIAVSACKQSLTWYLPDINPMIDFSDFVNRHEEFQRFIAVCDPEAPIWNQETKLTNRVCVLIGPEGDFTPNEWQQAKELGWNNLSLGTKRLRTETAALLAVCQANFLGQ
jgi:16S rRNA (uracil1498-N3)-methyltransferase